MAFEDFKDLTRRTTSDKILCDKSFNIAKNPKYDQHLRGLSSMIYFLIKKFLVVVVVLKMKIFQTKN